MRTRKIVLTLATLFAAVTICFATQDAFMGTWKLNEAKSKIPAGSGKMVTSVYVATADGVKVTADGLDARGDPTRAEWTGKFDGKYYSVTGDPDVDMRSYTRVNNRTLRIRETKGGKVVLSGTISLSADGKTRTATVTLINAKGIKVATTRVYDKQ